MTVRTLPQSATARDLASLILMNAACVSTLYWAQSLVLRAAAEFGPGPLVRLMPGATLAGYAVGVALLASVVRDLNAPAGLILHLIVLTFGLCTAAWAPEASLAVLACFVIGVGCSVTQRLLACATSAVPPTARAQTIGWIIAGGLFGIVLARACVPIASAWLGWRTLFWIDGVIVAILGLLVATTARRALPQLGTAPLPSAMRLWREEPVIRQAALQQAVVFAAFNLGWALFPRLLAADGIAPSLPMGIVAALGAGTAIAAGRVCAGRPGATVAAHAGLSAAAIAIVTLFLASHVAISYISAMALLDIGTQLALVANQARAQALADSPAMRGRITALVTTVGFIGGASGAALGNLLR